MHMPHHNAHVTTHTCKQNYRLILKFIQTVIARPTRIVSPAAKYHWKALDLAQLLMFVPG
ncbi:hypothetical protein BCR44DRAFT_1433752 [Catenaria anguillulae PL171]|uniref:Uncharacterized protein n=1 Tax=Catenaria anguillulae PL171 TaxID=765915 RepID=A0A1Y2HMV9_9FUNG|nr:hypothetical protein BCR44DRAFT_1433752 [Catenaria anguillulae PL171]